MGKLLIILTIVLAATAAGLGVLNQRTLGQTKTDLDLSKQETASTKTALAAEQKKVSESEKSLADLTAQKQLSEGEVTKFKGEVTTLNAKVTDLTTQLATKDSELGVKTTELQAKDEKITALEKKAEDATLNPPAVTDDSKAQMAELETLKTKLETELAGAQSKIKSLEEKALEKKKSQDLKTLTGRILAVNQAWNFVVLNIGNRNGIESNSEFLVRRGTTLIGKVRITTVEPANSIADIVPGSLKQGLSIQPGDDVIFQTERN